MSPNNYSVTETTASAEQGSCGNEMVNVSNEALSLYLENKIESLQRNNKNSLNSIDPLDDKLKVTLEVLSL